MCSDKANITDTETAESLHMNGVNGFCASNQFAEWYFVVRMLNHRSLPKSINLKETKIEKQSLQQQKHNAMQNVGQ